MPVMNGFEFIKKSEKYSSQLRSFLYQRLILMTANNQKILQLLKVDCCIQKKQLLVIPLLSERNYFNGMTSKYSKKTIKFDNINNCHKLTLFFVKCSFYASMNSCILDVFSIEGITV
jgi:hypothetical protein